MRRRTRQTTAVLCLIVVACAVLLPASTPTSICTEFIPLWLVTSDSAAVIIEGTAGCSDEQLVSLLALDSSRAPPFHAGLA